MIRITENANITSLTTFGIPAECGRLVEYDTPDDLARLAGDNIVDNTAICLGGGSNMLFATGRSSATFLHCTDTRCSITADGNGQAIIKCGAGASLDQVCRLAAEQGLWGLENLSGIPGTVGGAAVQNAGAYGVELADVLDHIDIFSYHTRSLERVTADSLDYGYRHSKFKDPAYADGRWITSVTLKAYTTARPNIAYKGLAQALGLGDHPSAHDLAALTPMAVRQAVLAVRQAKLPSPATTGSAGSFFKNPVLTASQYDRAAAMSGTEPPCHINADGNRKLSAAWLIDQAGCKGMQAGGAGLWPTQPLVIVNNGNATGADVARLCEMIQQAVAKKFGISLQPEVLFINS